MTTGKPQKHSIDNYIIRVRNRSKDLDSRTILTTYGLMMYFSLKPYLSDIIGVLGSAFSTLLAGPDSHSLYKTEGTLIFFTSQHDLAYTLVDLISIKVNDPELNKKANVTSDCLYNIFCFSGINLYLPKLFSNKFTDEETFNMATGKLMQHNLSLSTGKEVQLLNRIFRQMTLLNKAGILAVQQKCYDATCAAFDELNVSITEVENPDIELTILPAYTFRIKSENIDLTITDIIHSFAAVGWLCYKKVFNYPTNEIAGTFVHFAKTAGGKKRRWQNNKCIISYKTRVHLIAGFLASLFSEEFIGLTLKAIDPPATLKGFIASLRWMTIKPEIFLFLCNQQGKPLDRKLAKRELTIPGIGRSDNDYVKDALHQFAGQVATLKTNDLKQIQIIVFKKACIKYLDTKNNFEHINPLMPI